MGLFGKKASKELKKKENQAAAKMAAGKVGKKAEKKKKFLTAEEQQEKSLKELGSLKLVGYFMTFLLFIAMIVIAFLVINDSKDWIDSLINQARAAIVFDPCSENSDCKSDQNQICNTGTGRCVSCGPVAWRMTKAVVNEEAADNPEYGFCLFNETKYTFSEAQAKCAELDLQLVQLTTDTFKLDAMSLFCDTFCLTWLDLSCTGKSSCTSAGNYKWADGRSYQGTGEAFNPNRNGESCVAWKTNVGQPQLESSSCTEGKKYVALCEPREKCNNHVNCESNQICTTGDDTKSEGGMCINCRDGEKVCNDSGSKCFCKFDGDYSFDEGIDKCNSLGLQLVTIKDEDVETAVEEVCDGVPCTWINVQCPSGTLACRTQASAWELGDGTLASANSFATGKLKLGTSQWGLHCGYWSIDGWVPFWCADDTGTKVEGILCQSKGL